MPGDETEKQLASSVVVCVRRNPIRIAATSVSEGLGGGLGPELADIGAELIYVGVSRIFWDTNLFIYLIEGEGERSDAVVRLRERMLTRGDSLLTSTLTLGEVLVRPTEQNAHDLAAEYERLLSAGTTVLTFDVKAARAFAAIRRDRSIRPPDAIQLACAAEARVDLFITNDNRLSDKIVPGIQFVTSLDRAFL